MKRIFIITLSVTTFISKAQTVEEIDRLRIDILQNLDQYQSVEFSNEIISNEDAVRYDTARFYYDEQFKLVYIHWRERSHTFHVSGDGIRIRELFFWKEKVVFRRNLAYRFLNPQWHREPDINETEVSVSESIREYYNLDGTALGDFQSRRAEGKYKNLFALLDSIPLEQKLSRRWSDRCDECIDRDYLTIYRKLLEEQKENE